MEAIKLKALELFSDSLDKVCEINNLTKLMYGYCVSDFNDDSVTVLINILEIVLEKQRQLIDDLDSSGIVFYNFGNDQPLKNRENNQADPNEVSQ